MILGIPWWVHRRRRARVKIERTIQAWPSLSDDVGLPGSKIASAVADAWGWTARVILKKGTTTDNAVAKFPAIESGLGVRRGSVRVTPDDSRADRFTLRVIETDPHAAPIPWQGITNTSITRPRARALRKRHAGTCALAVPAYADRRHDRGLYRAPAYSGLINEFVTVGGLCKTRPYHPLSMVIWL